VIGTASPAKHGALRAMGIDHVLDSGSGDLETEVARLTNGRGVDVVLDARGGEQLAQSYRMLARLGRSSSTARRRWWSAGSATRSACSRSCNSVRCSTRSIS